MEKVNENVTNEEVVVETVCEEESKEGLLSKVKTGFKKHGKKIAVTAAVTVAGIIGYMLGSKSDDGYEYIDSYTSESLDAEPDSNEAAEN